jgi:UDP-GlcNAc:undecaprenyl-phosphate GlcNAc-1-phosphate transferase
MSPYLLVFMTAAVVTAGVMPGVIWLVRRFGAIDVPHDPRKVHTEPVPTMGGIGMVIGFLAAMAVAANLADFSDLFETTSEPLGLILGVLAIAVVGIVDDVRGLPPTAKLAGQILAALAPVFFGIQIIYAWVPGLDVVALPQDIGLPLTILAIIAMVNAVNLIDGLDGLAAGVVGIAAIGFFTFTQLTGSAGLTESVPSSGPLVAAILAGICLGFLVHNFHPAKVFMGDTGAMVLGLLLALAGVAFVGRTTAPEYGDFAGSVPLLVPALVLAIPFLDTLFAVARRAYRGQGIAVADKGHLHHLLIAFGHSHRRAVLTMYYWSAVVAFAAVGWVVADRIAVLVATAAAVVVGTLLTALGVRTGASSATQDDGSLESDDAVDTTGEVEPSPGATVHPLRRDAV